MRLQVNSCHKQIDKEVNDSFISPINFPAAIFSLSVCLCPLLALKTRQVVRADMHLVVLNAMTLSRSRVDKEAELSSGKEEEKEKERERLLLPNE